MHFNLGLFMSLQNNGGCSDICAMTTDDVIYCLCPPEKTLQQDGKTCKGEIEMKLNLNSALMGN